MGPVAAPRRRRTTYLVTRTWLARGPFALDSTLNVTLSPPRRESKLSTLSRWKRYSLPSDAEMKPKPRSETIFLMVPFATGLLHSSRTHAAHVAGPVQEEVDASAKRANSGRQEIF